MGAEEKGCIKDIIIRTIVNPEIQTEYWDLGLVCWYSRRGFHLW